MLDDSAAGRPYVARGSVPVTLVLKKMPRGIGIYLDYELGQVSFYNLNDMSHIHSFWETFSEVLKPYFYIGCCPPYNFSPQPLVLPNTTDNIFKEEPWKIETRVFIQNGSFSNFKVISEGPNVPFEHPPVTSCSFLNGDQALILAFGGYLALGTQQLQVLLTEQGQNLIVLLT
ncbi:hypothetical protein QTO34_015886 [Cnephaeus nilssonii]|uniref:B30.2/SPRY domain-containing protein n=1 Tax=Cnephaeus nilssonii TaxID=3371016 RepID=A0AA40I4Y1_CNENI|nr:hypothetical protein QTO34_015886 [Eptesicus nilssonii]